MSHHPIRITVTDDLERSRLTVGFRLILAIPHLIWLSIWGAITVLVVIVNWFATLFKGISPIGLHNTIASYVRYATHVAAYLSLAANPYPGFLGEPGSYPVDAEIDPPQRQNRWITGFRAILALPALFFASALYGSGGARYSGYSFSGGLLATVAILGWFACLAVSRMPRGMRDAAAYSLSYAAQLDGYLFLLTDRYPNSDPRAALGPVEHPAHPVSLADHGEDLRRSRLTVFFRLLLAIPHLVWLSLWGIAVAFATVGNWFATLFSGRSPSALHRFLAAYIRYQAHVSAYLYLVGNPFPGFTGEAGSYPVDIEIAGPERQNRWITGFRLILALPALLLASGFSNMLALVAIGGWFTGLFTARMPRGLRNIGAVAIRYNAQLYAYLLILTDRYPYSGPTDELVSATAPPDAAPTPALV